MNNFLTAVIWFLTDTDFVKEWTNRKFFSKLELCYTTVGIIFFEMLSFAIFIKAFENGIERIF